MTAELDDEFNDPCLRESCYPGDPVIRPLDLPTIDPWIRYDGKRVPI